MAKGRGPKHSGAGLLDGLEKLQEELRRAQAELAGRTVEATAGGGAVRVVMSGTQECRSIQIAPELLQAGDIEMLQDLIQLAVNQAIHDSRMLAAQRLGPLAGGAGPAGSIEGGG
jgi:DNA-binding YbaB/EbfC family protein